MFLLHCENVDFDVDFEFYDIEAQGIRSALWEQAGLGEPGPPKSLDSNPIHGLSRTCLGLRGSRT